MKRLITTFTVMAFAVLLTAPVHAAHYWQIKISDPAAVINSRTFNVEFTTLSVEKNDDITVRLYQNGVATSNQDTTTKEFGDSGSFRVTVPSDGTYEYYVRATSSVDGTKESRRVQTTVDTRAPGTPRYEGSNRVGNTYTLPYTAPNTGDVTQLRFYSSTSTSFVASTSTQVGAVDVTPGQSGRFQYTANSSAQRYHAVQAFDAAGNFSSLVSDPNVTVSQGAVAPVNDGNGQQATFGTAAATPGGGVQAQATDENGNVLGEQNADEDGVVTDEAVSIEEDGDVQGAQDEARNTEDDGDDVQGAQDEASATAGDENNVLIVALIAIPLILGLGYYLFGYKGGRFSKRSE